MAARAPLAPPAPLAGLALVLLTILPAGSAAQEEHPGKAPYDQWCAGCHGVEGRGDGPAAAYMLPQPRDFTRALYQIRSTPSGELPTDEDLMRIIDEGMPGTTMPGWEDALSRGQRRDILEYIKTFSPFFEQFGTPEPMEFSRAPGVDEEVLATGAEVYQRIECYRCHGEMGRGEGNSAPTLEDEKERPVRAADLTENWLFTGGGSVEEIYRRLRTGLNGTPMPSQQDLLDAGVVSEDELWALAHYVRSLSPEREPRVREVIRAAVVEEGQELPSTPGDERWDEVERFYVPLVGQVIEEPRWFDPRVDGVWVQALHDGANVALLVSWSDPSQSPDPEWEEWWTRVVEIMEPHEGEPFQGPEPDQLMVQFPREIPEGRERPYFLMGDQGNPVYQWGWRSTGESGEFQARGMAEWSDSGESDDLNAASTWEAGQWKVLFRRSFATPDTATELQFRVGEPIPVAFFAWDGDNGEADARAAVSSWFYLYLQGETPATVFVAPLLAMLITVGLGMVVVSRAQKREGRSAARDEAAGATESGRSRRTSNEE